MKLVIVDYGTGNVGSILNMLKKIGVPAIISSSVSDIEVADKIILPGVGSFDKGMNEIKKRGLITVLNKKALTDKVPILGICLGMQLMATSSTEGEELGLGWFPAKVRKFNFNGSCNLPIPHMGWNFIKPTGISKLFDNIGENPKFYFVHSFHIDTNILKSFVSSYAGYGYDFPASIESGNIMAVQFHPEKSHKYGMQVFTNFIKNY